MEIERERMRRKYIDRYERDRDRGMDHRRYVPSSCFC